MNALTVKYKKLRPSARLPEYTTPGSAAVDLVYPGGSVIDVFPGDVVKIGLGFAIHIGDPGFAAFIFPRSGLGTRGLVLANGTGVIDSDYQGEVIVALTNRSKPRNGSFGPGVTDNVVTIRPGDRIAQMVFMPVAQARFIKVDEFADVTERGEGGFGSTGV